MTVILENINKEDAVNISLQNKGVANWADGSRIKLAELQELFMITLVDRKYNLEHKFTDFRVCDITLKRATKIKYDIRFKYLQKAS